MISEKMSQQIKSTPLRKMELKFQNPKLNISCEIGYCTFFVVKYGNFGVNRSMTPFQNK